MNSFKKLCIFALFALAAVAAAKRKSEYKPGVRSQHVVNPLPQDYVPDASLPDNWDWRVRLFM